MALYSIRELEHLSGIKAHTIRMWEQRYVILCPERTCTNVRTYTDCDLKALLNISLLNEHGVKISQIARMSATQIAEQVMSLATTTPECSAQIGCLVLAMVELDEDRFNKVFSTAVLQIGLENTMIKVIFPFLERIGILWLTGNINPAQEHFVSMLIRQKLIVAVDGQQVPNSGDVLRYLLYLPEGELHEVSLIFQSYLIRANGAHAMYLGQNLPYADLKSAARIYKPHYISTVLTTRPERENLQAYLNRLSEDFPDTRIYVSGFLLRDSEVDLPPNLMQCPDIGAFAASLEQNARQFKKAAQ